VLTERELGAIRALEAEVVAHDGGRLKLEHGALVRGEVETALRWEGNRLLGFAGRYAFGHPHEIAGMVAPASRRQGIATALLSRLRTPPALLVVPSGTPAGRAFAESLGASRDRSEHFLALGETPTTGADEAITTRTAGPDDDEAVRGLLRRAFDWEPPVDLLQRFGDATRVVELDGLLVGTLRVSVTGGSAGIYGFAVDPDHQGKGIGRDVLARTCRELRANGIDQVTLEVETENVHALALYTSLGFTVEAGEDYWSLPSTG
jgi:ribosomal protein S18 acetylase RimI-like enzyme